MHFGIELPQDVKNIIKELEDNGFEGYAVGGCVRDSILNKTPGDWDITTSAKPESIKRIFKRTVDTGIKHGTVTVLAGKNAYEVTTYRMDGEYIDHRHPESVTFTSELVEDLKRRDFTINAMAYNDKSGLIDVFDGMGDIERRVIRCVGEPRERFSEDALRMMRAVRFAAQLDFEIDEDTFQAVRELSETISKISAERVRTELVKLISSDRPDMLRLLYDSGITGYVLPEFDLMMRTPQVNPHHMYSVGEHTIHAMCNIKNDSVLRLTMLLHDVSKPECKSTDKKGIDHFHGHPKRGKERAREILRRLKFDNRTIKKVCTYVEFHDYKPFADIKNIRFLISSIGRDYFPGLFDIKRADIGAQSAYMQKEKLDYVDELERAYEKIIEDGDCLSVSELAINGSELMKLGYTGTGIGECLEHLLDLVLTDPSLNEKEELLKLAEEYKKI